MKKLSVLFLFLLMCQTIVLAQTKVNGVVKDATTGETLIGANVVYGNGQGTITDFDGKFSLNLPNGEYDLQISFVGYESETRHVTASGSPVYLEVKLKSETLDEVVVVADVARSRETPVAFTNVLPSKIQEELAGQDIPMILNSTPGVYATQQGGGDGDARITIRGFNQRNVAVMLDGIPVNDMENGWVYWSNWFGLDAVTRSIQVQRGLGASKLALPSVGGTMNIITKGIENERQVSVKQSVNEFGKWQTSVGYTSGMLDNGLGITMATSYKRGEGWVDATFTEAAFYYLKIDKRWNKHITSISAMGAPQQHGQRSYKRAIATYDAGYATDLGVPLTATNDDGETIDLYPINDMGIGYNYQSGYLRRDRYNENAGEEQLTERLNFYHKPMFSLRDFWTISDRMYMSNIFYMSIGRGGGTRARHSLNNNNLISDPNHPHYGQIDWQAIYDANTKPTQGPFGETYPINPRYSDTKYFASNYLVASKNEHQWYGWLSTTSFQLNDQIEISGGVDLRTYTAIHYQEVHDLLGADYAIDEYDTRYDYDADPTLAMKYEGDKVNYYDEGYVNWGGVFSQLEYTTGKLAYFINLTGAYTGYKKNNIFGRSESDWKYQPSFTAKGGFNYNFTDRMNAFINLGYLSKVRAYQYFFRGYTAEFVDDTDNELVKAIELGYTYGSPRFALNLNAYYTMWQNKPTSQIRAKYIDPTDEEEKDTFGQIPGMNALHQGVELDFVFQISPKLELQGLASIGDWIWDKKVDNLQMYYSDDPTREANVISFDATGIHVGDAAQTQFAGSLRYEPIKGLYFNAKATYFDRHFADFNPEETTDDEGNPVDSWSMPDYLLVDFHAGYNFKIPSWEKLRFSLRFSMLNVLNEVYITDARNNDSYIQKVYQDFDAKSASVFMGAPRRMNMSFTVRF